MDAAIRGLVCDRSGENFRERHKLAVLRVPIVRSDRPDTQQGQVRILLSAGKPGAHQRIPKLLDLHRITQDRHFSMNGEKLHVGRIAERKLATRILAQLQIVRAVGPAEEPEVSLFVDLLDLHGTCMGRDAFEAAVEQTGRGIVGEMAEFCDRVVAS